MVYPTKEVGGWQRFSVEEQNTALAHLKSQANFKFPDRSELKWAKLPFYADLRLLSLADLALPPPNERFFLYGMRTRHDKAEPYVRRLDWTNVPIYETNDDDPDKFWISRFTVKDYARFFFHYVRGQLGRFIIVETPEDIPWSSDAKTSDKQKVEKDVKPIAYKGHYQRDLYRVRSTVVFKNALFETDILIAPYETAIRPEAAAEVNGADEGAQNEERFTCGQMQLANEDLLHEDLPIDIDPPPGEMG